MASHATTAIVAQFDQCDSDGAQSPDRACNGGDESDNLGDYHSHLHFSVLRPRLGPEVKPFGLTPTTIQL